MIALEIPTGALLLIPAIILPGISTEIPHAMLPGGLFSRDYFFPLKIHPRTARVILLGILIGSSLCIYEQTGRLYNKKLTDCLSSAKRCVV